MLTNAIEIMGYCKASAGRAQLNVVFESKNQPRHNGTTIFLPKITAHTTETECLEIMASVDHEVAHDRYSDFNILKSKSIAMDSPLGFVWNFLEDSRVNAIEAKEYEGFRQLWDTTSVRLIDGIKNKIKAAPKSPMAQIMGPLIRWDGRVSKEWFPECAVSCAKFPMNPKLEAILEGFTGRLIAAQLELDKKRGSLLTYELAEDVCKAFSAEIPPPPPPPVEVLEERKDVNPAKGKAEEKKSKEVKTGKEISKEIRAEEKASEEVKAGKVTTEVTEEDKEEAKVEDDWMILSLKLPDEEKLLITPIREDTLDGTTMSKVGLHYDTDEAGKSAWTMTPLEEFYIVDFVNHTASNAWLIEKFFVAAKTDALEFVVESFNERIVPKIVAGDNFAQQVRREIQIRARVRCEYGVKQGKMDYSRLSRIVTKLPGYSERVFKRKISTDTLDAAISVLVDFSGSMGGDKLLFATGAAMLMNKVCSTLHVPLEITGFTDLSYGGVAPVQYIFKPFATNKVAEEDLLLSFGAASTHMCGNPDGENILWAYNRIVKRKEKKKLLIVMSDGQPAATKRESGIAGFTLRAIREIERLNQVQIYGLGLENDAVEKYYKTHSVITRAEEIPTKLLELIERKLLND